MLLSTSPFTPAFLREPPPPAPRQPATLSPPLPTSSRFTNKLFVLQFEHPSPRFLCVAQRQDCSRPLLWRPLREEKREREKEGRRENPSFLSAFLFARPSPALNTRISTHREFNPRAFRERRRFLLGNSALFRSDCERPPPCSRWDERTSVFCRAFQLAPCPFSPLSLPHPLASSIGNYQRFRDARAHVFAPVSCNAAGVERRTEFWPVSERCRKTVVQQNKLQKYP